MKFLADENIGLEIVFFLRTLGHDVVSIIELAPGSTDETVLDFANQEKRILITSDTDFGELVYLMGQRHAGVILLRLKNETNRVKIQLLETLLKIHSRRIKGKFTVVTEDKIRIRL